MAAPSRLAPDEAAAVRRAVASVLSSTSWVLGPAVSEFEAAWGRYVGRPAAHVVGVGNGTDALAVAFAALGLEAGAGVLVAADEGGYASTAARMTGLVPIAADSGDLGPTVVDLEAAWHPGVVAVVVTHLHGNPVPMGDIDGWRRERGLILIEDCAQAHGLRGEGGHVGSVGDAATFSFYPTKNLGAVGDGGAVVFSDRSPADVARELRQYGWGERYRSTRSGGRNTRLDSLQAAILDARLPFLDARNQRRRDIAARYGEVVPILSAADSVHHHAVALFADRDDRDGAAASLAAAGIDTAVHYPWLITEMAGLGVGTGGVSGASLTPKAAARRDRKLSLPCFPELTDAEVDHVVAALRRLPPASRSAASPPSGPAR